jgi:hypothetical protein
MKELLAETDYGIFTNGLRREMPILRPTEINHLFLLLMAQFLSAPKLLELAVRPILIHKKLFLLSNHFTITV